MQRTVTQLLILTCAVIFKAEYSAASDLPMYDAACVPEFNGGNHCTSNALSFQAVSIEPDRTHCNAGEEINLNIGITLGSGKVRNAAQRYNVGIWIGEHGEPAIGGNQCTFTGLQPATTDSNQIDLLSGAGPYRLTNNDSCGDVLDSEQTYYEFQASSVLCQDTNGNGKLDIPIAVAWHNNANQDLCSAPTDETSYFPRQSSACREVASYDIDTIIVEPSAEIEVYKTANPRFVRGNSGEVYFEVEVFNESDRTDELVITSLVDNQFGNLAGQGNCETGARLSAGESYRCEFRKTLSGNPGDVHENTVTATAVDDLGESVTAADNARVLFIAASEPPQADIRVIKTASPHSVNEPGGPVVYQVELWNDGETDLRLTALDDSQTGGDGTLNGVGSCSLPQDIAKGLSYSCGYTLQVTGRYPSSIVNTVTATAVVPNGGDEVTATDTVVVNLRDTPVALSMKKLPRTSIISGRTNVTYELVIENHSLAKSVTLSSLVDNYHGDVTNLDLNCGSTAITDPLSLTLTPGTSIECTFTGSVPEVSETVPTETAYYPDTVTASGTADDGSAVSVIATAEVQLIPEASEIQPSPVLVVVKIAQPDRVPVTGGDVTFTAEIINASASESINVEELIDDIHGDLSGVGTCANISTSNPLEIEAGSSYSCAFTKNLSGAAGEIERDTITAYGRGNSTGESALGFDAAAVQFTEVPLRVTVSKTPSQNLVDPGTAVIFAVEIKNENTFDVEVTDLTDSAYGDLNGIGTCTVPVTVNAGKTAQCTFQKAVVPNVRPRVHNNVVTISAQPAGSAPSNRSGVTASDQAWILFTTALSDIPLPVPAFPHIILMLASILGITWLGRRNW